MLGLRSRTRIRIQQRFQLLHAALWLARVRASDRKRDSMLNIRFIGILVGGYLRLRLLDRGTQSGDLDLVELLEIASRINILPIAPSVDHQRGRRSRVRKIIVRLPSCVGHDQLLDAVAVQVCDPLNRSGSDKFRLVIHHAVDLTRIAGPTVSAAGALNDYLLQTVAVDVSSIELAKREEKVSAPKDCLRSSAIALQYS